MEREGGGRNKVGTEPRGTPALTWQVEGGLPRDKKRIIRNMQSEVVQDPRVQSPQVGKTSPVYLLNPPVKQD